MEEKVSVIIPVYNAEKYINKCVQSILNQTFNNYEIILVNDGSTDNSLEICNELSKKNERILVIDKENGGPSSARNIGIERATGKFILFVDSDDYINGDMIEKMVKAYEKDIPDIVVCGYNRLKYRKQKLKGIKKIVSKGNLLIGKKEIIDYYYPIYDCKSFNSIWGKMYLVNIIREKSIYFNENVCMGEDYLFNLFYFQFVGKEAIIEDALYNYIIEYNVSTNKYEENLFDHRMILWDKTYKIYQKNNLNLKYIYQLYLKFIYSQICEFNHPNCNLNKQEKDKTIITIINDEKTKKIINSTVSLDIVYKIFAFFIKHRLILMMKLTGRFIYVLKKIKNIL